MLWGVAVCVFVVVGKSRVIYVLKNEKMMVNKQIYIYMYKNEYA